MRLPRLTIDAVDAAETSREKWSSVRAVFILHGRIEKSVAHVVRFGDTHCAANQTNSIAQGSEASDCCRLIRLVGTTRMRPPRGLSMSAINESESATVIGSTNSSTRRPVVPRAP